MGRMKRFERASVPELADRVRELRRRHFGSRGKAAFAERLGVAAPVYETFERGTIPPPDALVRMCEVTGEDLQWLLTGVASRGTMVITGALDRHQALLARVARMIASQPERANAIEAFVELLEMGDAGRAAPELPRPAGDPIPILAWDALPLERGALAEAVRQSRAALPPSGAVRASAPATLAEPTARPTAERACAVECAGSGAWRRELVRCGELEALPSDSFAVRVPNDDAAPLVMADDVVIVVPVDEPRVGHPALCRLESGPVVGVWLGREGGAVLLGRLCDGEERRIPDAGVRWLGAVAYRVRLAA